MTLPQLKPTTVLLSRYTRKWHAWGDLESNAADKTSYLEELYKQTALDFLCHESYAVESVVTESRSESPCGKSKLESLNERALSDLVINTALMCYHAQHSHISRARLLTLRIIVFPSQTAQLRCDGCR